MENRSLLLTTPAKHFPSTRSGDRKPAVLLKSEFYIDEPSRVAGPAVDCLQLGGIGAMGNLRR